MIYGVFDDPKKTHTTMDLRLVRKERDRVWVWLETESL